MSSWLDLVVEGKEASSTLVDIPPWYPNLQQLVLQGCVTASPLKVTEPPEEDGVIPYPYDVTAAPMDLVKVHIEGIDSEALWPQGERYFAAVPPGDHYHNSTPLARAVLANCNGAQQLRQLKMRFTADGVFWFRLLVAPPCPPSRL